MVLSNDEMHAAIVEINAIVLSEEFGAWRKAFVEENMHVFTYEEEEKLEYTTVHQEYEKGIESMITQKLGERIPMAGFLEQLPEYLEGAGKDNDESDAALQLLMQAIDYRNFKEMMLYEKHEREKTASLPASATWEKEART